MEILVAIIILVSIGALLAYRKRKSSVFGKSKYKEDPWNHLEAETPKESRTSVNGLIGYYGLSDWWLSEFTEEERAYIEEKYQPLGSTDTSLTKGDIEFTSQSEISFLSNLSGWFSKPNDREMAKKILRKTEDLLPKGKVLDVHFMYQAQIETYYKERDSDPAALEKAINACRAQIALAPKAAKAFKRQWGPPLPAHVGYRQLAIIMEKRKDFDEAIRISKQSLSQGWMGDWENRIERCERRRKQVI